MQIPLDNLKSSLRDRIDLLIKIGFGVAVAIGCYFVVSSVCDSNSDFRHALRRHLAVLYPVDTMLGAPGERCPLFSWSRFLP